MVILMSDIIQTLSSAISEQDAVKVLHIANDIVKQYDEGLIKVLPCKPGTEVYRPVVFLDDTKLIAKGIIEQYSFMNDGDEFYFKGIEELITYDCWFDLSAFGVLVFLTRAEAEKALKERENK